jgi:hypothetical protein
VQMPEESIDIAKKLINSLKNKKIIFLNAEKWNIIFDAYQSRGELSKDAESIIWIFAYSLINQEITRLNFNSRFEEEYITRAIERLNRYILQYKKSINITLFRMNVGYGAYGDVVRRNKDAYASGFMLSLDQFYKATDDKLPSIAHLICREQEEVIVSEYLKLPPKQKQAIYGRYEENKLYRELEKDFGRSLDSIKGACCAARETLDIRLHKIDEDKPDIKTMLEGVKKWPV